MFWSDSAPHPKEKKESWAWSAGVFTAPVVLPLLAELFEKNNKLENLQKFISENAQKIYGIKPIKKEIIIEKQDFIIPEMYGNVVPFFSGKTISWNIKEKK
jgi:dihydroorotase